MGEFEGKSVIVTGGALGIGGGVSRAFATAGASVTIMDIDDDAGDALVKELTGQGAAAQYISADAGTIEGCRATADAALDAYGGIDIVINNVGIQPPSSYVDAVDLPEESWERIININLRSRFLMAKYSVPSMRNAAEASSSPSPASKASSPCHSSPHTQPAKAETSRSPVRCPSTSPETTSGSCP